MLTKADRTIPDGLEVLDEIAPLGLEHLGFKDVGGDAATLGALAERIRAMGAISYMEIVSTSREAVIQAAKLAREIRIDRLLGGTAVDEVLEILRGSKVQYLPFPGRPFDHPTKLGGAATQIEEHCRAFADKGCAGVDLLAFRATEADPVELVRIARRTTPGFLLVAGGVRTRAQVKAIADAGADAFTVGSAVFDGSFAPQHGSMRSQLRAVLDACR